MEPLDYRTVAVTSRRRPIMVPAQANTAVRRCYNACRIVLDALHLTAYFEA